ncbi:MAG: Mur ligase family protein [Pseudomonadota bacterium]
MTDQTFLEKIFSKQPSHISLGLDRMVAAYEFLGSPSSTIPVMLVGGTNGKGSTAAVASIALSNRGFKVGLYTSPHLLSFAERIVVSDHKTTMEELASFYNDIETKLQALNWDQLTFFEATTLLALSYFEAKSCDVLIIEVGLGGRLDATNVLSPLVSIVTSIDLDHMEWLGPTLEDIAKEKLGIARPHRPLLLGEGFSIHGFDHLAESTEAQVHHASRHRSLPTWVEARGLTFSANARLGLQGAELILKAMGIPGKVEGDLGSFLPPSLAGRTTEILFHESSLFCDISHNPAGIKALKFEFVRRYGAKRVPVFVSVLRDKDVAGILDEFASFHEPLVFFRTASPRSIKSKSELSSLWPGQIEWYDSFQDLWNCWSFRLSGRGSAIIGGSFTAVAAAMEFFGAKDIYDIDFPTMEFKSFWRQP